MIEKAHCCLCCNFPRVCILCVRLDEMQGNNTKT